MLRKLGIVGLGVPLVAVIAALAYLFLFGTSEPTFDAATRDLASDHTVLRIRDEPPAALIVPIEPVATVVLVFTLPDDERHVWSASRALGLLDYVDSHGLAVIPVTGTIAGDHLSELATLAAELVRPSRTYVVAYEGAPLTSLCEAGELEEDWSGVVVVNSAESGPAEGCARLPILAIEDQRDPAARIVQWMLERQ